MAALVKYYCFSQDLAQKAHNLLSDTFKIALTNTAPALTDTTWSLGTYPAPVAANGYPAGGNDITVISCAQTAGTTKWILSNSAGNVFTATAGGIGPFRYAIYYNSSNANKLIGYQDYGSPISLANTETFDITHDTTDGTLDIV